MLRTSVKLSNTFCTSTFPYLFSRYKTGYAYYKVSLITNKLCGFNLTLQNLNIFVDRTFNVDFKCSPCKYGQCNVKKHIEHIISIALQI